VQWRCFVEQPEPGDWRPAVFLKGGGAKLLYMPLWIPFFLFAGYPTIAFIRGPVRRWRRRRTGLCQKCGYDLTGNVSGVCPECGFRVLSPP